MGENLFIFFARKTFFSGMLERSSLFFALISVFLSEPSLAAVPISVPENIAAAPGQTFEVPVTLGTVSSLVGYYIELSYSAQVEYTGVQNGTLTASWPAPVVNSQTGRCSVAGYGMEPAVGSGTLVTVLFRIKPTAPIGHISTMHFRTSELNDGALLASPQDGMVTVADIAVLSLPSVLRYRPGDEFSVPVDLRDADGVVGFLFTLSYAPGILEYLGTESGTLPGAWGAPTVNLQSGGRLTVGGWSAQAFTGTATVLTLRFRVRDEALIGEETYLDLPSAELNDGALPVATESGQVIITEDITMPFGGVARYALVLVLVYMIRRRNVRCVTGRTSH